MPIENIVVLMMENCGLSHHLESVIDHAGARTALMAHAHEALSDSMAQARLATDRVEAFVNDRSRASGVVGTMAKLFHLK